MKILKKLNLLFKIVGFDFVKFFITIRESHYFIKTAIIYKIGSEESRFPLKVGNLRPMLTDRKSQAGSFNKIYLFQDIWAARKIFEKSPGDHTDVGSSIEGFVAHLLCFTSVKVIDIRPLNLNIDKLTFIQEDATTLARLMDDSVYSLSSLHAIEHFGLGRYGDHVDPNAYLLAMQSLSRVLMPGGRLYFSVPIGKERLQFNSQRIFNPMTIIEIFNELTLVSFSVVNDMGDYIENVCPPDFTDLKCGCGLFEFTK